MTWNETIARLKGWRGDQENLADEDLIPPSDETIDRAIAIAEQLERAGWCEPIRPVPDGESGITFEWRGPGKALHIFRSLTIPERGTNVTLDIFVDCSLEATIHIMADKHIAWYLTSWIVASSAMKRVPAECFPVGKFIEDELIERGWSAADLARESGCGVGAIYNIIAERCPLHPSITRGLARALGGGVAYWRNLEDAHTQWATRQREKQTAKPPTGGE